MLKSIDPEKNVTLRAMAYKLNDINVATTSGKGSWSANSVRRLKAVGN